MAEPLHPVHHRILSNKGILYEADIFSVLLRSPYVLRSFEFALTDGAIDCSREFDPAQSYAERFWDVTERGHPKPGASELLLFEVKSTAAGSAGDQTYLTTIQQRRRSAFYIGITAADPAFVDVVPNFFQEAPSLDDAEVSRQDSHGVEVNTTRVCYLPPCAYGRLDQCMSPYRMPIWLLPKAISLIRRCIRDGTVYVNPWTRVEIPNWRPVTTRRTWCIFPNVHSAQYSACLAVLAIFRNVRTADIRPDFPFLQPYLGDFKLFVSGMPQRVVQHKFDDALRAHTTPLTQVAVARGEAKDRRYYFTAFDRFDYLWYQIRISGEEGERLDFFFIPERELPDLFYTTTEVMASFELENFRKYRIEMDDLGGWVEKVENIIRANPVPRRAGERPLRTPLEEAPSETPVEEERGESAGARECKGRRGRKEYKETLSWSLQRFFFAIMELCATRQSGLLVVLATNHPLGDLAYCRYRWTEDERTEFLTHKNPPRAAHHLPPDTELVHLCYYTQYAECGPQGPAIRPRQFRRLDSCASHRLVIWDLGGPDSRQQQIMPVVIPTDDISTTPQQRAAFLGAISDPGANKGLPLLSSILKTGLYAAEYAVPASGPPLQARSWTAMLALLDRFLSLTPFMHPPGLWRQPEDYRQTLRSTNERLLREHGYGGWQDDPYDDDG